MVVYIYYVCLWFMLYRQTYPQYPPNCTDDWIDMNITFNYGDTEAVSTASKCHQLLWPKHLEVGTVYPFSVLPYSQQSYYWPDTDYGPYSLPPGYQDVAVPDPYYGIYLILYTYLRVIEYIGINVYRYFAEGG